MSLLFLTRALDSDENVHDDDDDIDSSEDLLSAFFFWLILFLLFLPSAMLCFWRLCRRSDVAASAERLRRQEQIAQALAETAAPEDEHRLKIIQKIFPPPPSSSSKTTTTTTTTINKTLSRLEEGNNGIDDHEASSSSQSPGNTARNNDDKDNDNNASASLLLQYDKDTNLYKWKKSARLPEILACSICLENFQNGEQQQILVSKCSHGFHLSCIMGWITVKDECHYCRQELWNKNVYDNIKEDIISMMVEEEEDDNNASSENE